MNYVVFDLEFNQDMNFLKVNLEDDDKPPFEIIQIGAIKLDSDFNLIESFNRYIKPTIYSNINPFIEDLTGIKIENLILESNFSSVYNDFIKFLGDEEIIFCTWGVSDIKELFNNINFHKLSKDLFSRKFINIQSQTSKTLGFKGNNLASLKFAVERLNIEISYDFHNALNDAYYTSEVLKKIYNASIKPTLYNASYVKKNKKIKSKVDYDSLISQFSKLYERHMTKEEEDIIKLAYKMGKTQQFLIKNRNND